MSESRRARREAERKAKRGFFSSGGVEEPSNSHETQSSVDIPPTATEIASHAGLKQNDPKTPSKMGEPNKGEPNAEVPGSAEPSGGESTGSTAEVAAGQIADVPVDAEPTRNTTREAAPRAENTLASKPQVVKGPEKAAKTKTKKVLGIVGSLAILSLGTAAIVAGSLYPAQLPGQGAASELTTLPAGDALATCPASVRLLKGAGADADPEFAPASKDSKSAIRAAVLSDNAGRIPGAQLLKLDGKSQQELAPRLDESEAAKLPTAAQDGSSERKGLIGLGIQSADPLTLRTQPLGGLQSLSGAARFYTAKDGDLAGLAAAGCSVPAAESWITGVTTTAGTTSVLHLVNPSASVAQIRIDLRGAEGHIEAPSLNEIALAPGENKSFVLAGYAPNEKSLALKIAASGGKVSAAVQQSSLHGLIPGGIDYVVGGSAAATEQVIPGVLLQDPQRANELSKADPSVDSVPEIHVSATSTEGATIKIRALGTKGEEAIPGGGELVVASNATARLPLTGLPAGMYTFVLEADSAVTASVKMVRGTKAKEPIDQAWAIGASRIGSEHLMPVPEFGNSQLVLNAPEDTASIVLRPLNKNGKLGAEKKIELAGGKTVALKPNDIGQETVAIMISASGAPAYAATLIEDGDAGIATLALNPAAAGLEGVQVQLRH